jgi:hypothetical protein
MTPDKIRAGFKQALASDSSPEAKQFVADLGNTSDGAAHEKDASAFIQKCNARDKTAMVKDILTYNAHLRTVAKAHRTSTPDGPQGIIEFSETFPTDNLGDTTKSFDPSDCVLK